MKNKLERVVHLVQRLLATEGDIMAAIDDLATQVASTQGVEASAVQALTSLAALYEAAIASGDQQKLIDLTAQLKTSADALASAIATSPTGPSGPTGATG